MSTRRQVKKGLKDTIVRTLQYVVVCYITNNYKRQLNFSVKNGVEG